MTTIKINSISLRGSWVPKTIHDECAICKNHLLEPCSKCFSTTNLECFSIQGECKHVYHLHCIDKWLETKKTCPLDNSEWKYAVKDKSNCKCSKSNNTPTIQTVESQPTTMSLFATQPTTMSLFANLFTQLSNQNISPSNDRVDIFHFNEINEEFFNQSDDEVPDLIEEDPEFFINI